MSSETQSYNKPNYGLSSWNYGSFHSSNPIYAPPRRANTETSVNDSKPQRCQSTNKYGKRKLAPEDRIVTDDYLKVMKDARIIKNATPHAQRRVNTSVRRSNDTGELNSSINRKDSMNDGPSQIQRKNLKYQLSFEEWAIMKNKQEEIYKRVQVIKESEDKKFELFNRKIDQNYEKVK
jgi:hypothetical protein